MSARTLSLIALAIVAVSPASLPANDKKAAGPAGKLTKADVEKKWADYWVEVEVTAGGKTIDPFKYWGYSFVKDPKDGSYGAWLLHGEAVLAKHYNWFTFDVTADPMRVDYNTIRGEVPGIFRFDGDDLVWVTPKEFRDGNPNFFKAPLKRPTDFTSTKENGHVVHRLKRTNGLYGIEPLEGKK